MTDRGGQGCAVSVGARLGDVQTVSGKGARVGECAGWWGARSAPESAPEMGRRVGIVPAVAVALTLRRAPALLDALRVAAALVGLGLGRVVLFGSLAEGRADPASDIDYVLRQDRQKPSKLCYGLFGRLRRKEAMQ